MVIHKEGFFIQFPDFFRRMCYGFSVKKALFHRYSFVVNGFLDR